MPLSDHYPVELNLRLPMQDMQVPTIMRTKEYRDALPGDVLLAWEEFEPIHAATFDQAKRDEDTEQMWNSWSCWAEAALASASHSWST
eukprot:555288-Heterocapsa_arctica.AAC.1